MIPQLQSQLDHFDAKGDVLERHHLALATSADRLNQHDFRIEQELRQTRYRQWKFEQVLRYHANILGENIPLQIAVTNGPATTEVALLSSLDFCQLVCDHSGRHHLHIKGWAWTGNSTIIALDLFLDGARKFQLDFGDHRKDVRQHFSGPETMESCGFSDFVALPDSFQITTKIVFQISDVDGHWTRFEIRPKTNEEPPEPTNKPAPRFWQRWSELTRQWQKRRQESANAFRREKTIRRLLKSKFSNSSIAFSVLLPVGDVSTARLQGTIEAFRGQVYENWRLLLLPINPQGQSAIDECRNRQKFDSRISCSPWDGKSKFEAINAAIIGSDAAYVTMLDAEVRPAADALAWAAIAISKQPDLAWLYGDGETVNAEGQFLESDRKPDFSEFHLWSRFFTHGLSFYRREEIVAAGGVRAEFPGAEEYDLALRLARKIPRDRIAHLSESLFQRERPALDSSADSWRCDESQVAAVRDVLQQAKITSSVIPHSCGVGVRQIEFSVQNFPRVVVVIPTRDKARLVRRCVESLRNATQYPNYEILVINNNSSEPELFEFFDDQRDDAKFSFVDYEKPFNHSAMHNEVLTDIDAEFAVLLNNDVCDFSAGWLEQLIAVIQLDDRIAGVGPMLVYPDRRIQHSGVIIGLGGIAGHAHVDIPESSSGYQGRLHCLQDMTACTAACLLVRMSAFWEVGGFESIQYPTSFNDVDLWLRLRDAGYRCIYQPAVSAVHYESISRGVTAADVVAVERMGKQLAQRDFCDPFYNPHLSLACERFKDTLPPKEARQAQWDRLIKRFEDTL